jgi:hypothetical protein
MNASDELWFSLWVGAHISLKGYWEQTRNLRQFSPCPSQDWDKENLGHKVETL